MSAGSDKPLLADIQTWMANLREYELVEEQKLARLEAAIVAAQDGRVEEPLEPLLVVLLLGASGAGKSELLNALAGERIAVSSHVRPTTTAPTVYLHESVPEESLVQLGALTEQLINTPAYVRRHRRPELQNKIVIDAPDIDSYRTEHRELVTNLIGQVDVVLYVVTPYTYKDDAGWQILASQKTLRAFAFILNKWDTQSSRDGSEIMTDFAHLLRERAGFAQPKIFRTIATQWSGTATGSNAAPDDFQELEHWLSSGLGSHEVSQIQRRNRAALLSNLSKAIAEAAPSGDQKFEQWQDTVTKQAAELATLRDLIVTHARQTARAAAAHDEELSENYTPGPFGLLMRLTVGVLHALRRVGRSLPSLAGAGTGPMQQLPAVLARRSSATVQSLQMITHQFQVPSNWVTRRWDEATARVEGQVASAIDAGIAAGVDRSRFSFRRTIALFLMVCFEIIMLALIILAIWRAGVGFLEANYVSSDFFTSFFILFFGAFLVGFACVSWLLPNARRRLERHLSSSLLAVWRGVQTQLTAPAAELSQQFEKSRREAEELIRRCREARNASLPDAHVAQIENLYSDTTPRPVATQAL